MSARRVLGWGGFFVVQLAFGGWMIGEAARASGPLQVLPLLAHLLVWMFVGTWVSARRG